MNDSSPVLDSLRLIEDTLDHGTFESWDVSPLRSGVGYESELAAARASTGLTESVVTGTGSLGGHRVAVIVGEFAFLGGSIGVAAAEAIVSAVTRATAERLPILAAPVSGGTRMQEGTVAFLQMIKITAAITAHKRAALPYLVYLRNPTTGGVFASWGSLGHMTIAEPGALIGFLGPRAIEAITGTRFPPGVQTAENLYRHGIVDAVVGPGHIAALVSKVLDILRPGLVRSEGSATDLSAPTLPDHPEASRAPRADDWATVESSRIGGRPGLRTLMRVGASTSVHLNGTASGAGFTDGDRGLSLGLARFGGHSVVVIGHDRRSQSAGAAIGPGAMRVAIRGIRLAEELGLPVVAVIDTPGAALSVEAEEGGLAGEIARCLAALMTTSVPTVSVILGQGSGGAALALIPSDRVLACENGWLSPLAPEGASAIVHRDTEHAPMMAAAQRIGAAHLVEDGIADEVILEHPSAELEPEAFCVRVAQAVGSHLDALGGEEHETRMQNRLERYHRLGRGT